MSRDPEQILQESHEMFAPQLDSYVPDRLFGPFMDTGL
jgi:hypothetical protein